MASNKPAFKSALTFGSGHLAACLARIAEQQQLLQLVRSTLPPEIAQHAMHCVISGNKLIIYVQTAGWASQIRFFQTLILNKLLASGQRNLGSLQVKLLRSDSLPTTRKLAVLPPAEIVQTLIRQTSSSSEDELEAALNRLGKTLQKRLRDKADEN